MTETPEPEVLFERRGALGVITLNRPQALNALALSMMGPMTARLDDWAADDGVAAVVVRSAGERAFCAGGDVVALYHAGPCPWDERGRGFAAELFRAEYTLDHRIHTFPKPYVSLLRGYSFGGGFGISVHGSHRVGTGSLLFALQETAIGLFPDVGGGWFLPLCPGETGTYLGLTGARCRLADCAHIGYVSHPVAPTALGAIVEDLAAADWGTMPAAAVVDAVLAHHVIDPGPAPLAEHRAAIDRCFGFDTVEEIMAALSAEGTEWAAATACTLASRSPTSLKISLRQLRLGRGMSYADCVTMEYRMALACMAGHDFYEGIRAVLIDKDNAPRWWPASLAEVDGETVARHFAALGAEDLIVAP